MAREAKYFGMALGAFFFWQSVHVGIALHQDIRLERLEQEMKKIRQMREELLAQAKERDSLA